MTAAARTASTSSSVVGVADTHRPVISGARHRTGSPTVSGEARTCEAKGPRRLDHRMDRRGGHRDRRVPRALRRLPVSLHAASGSRAQQKLLSELHGHAGLATLTGHVPPEGKAVAILDIPGLHLDQVVVEGTSATDLTAGPGLMPGSALPGTPGNTVIAGRRYLYGKPFSALGSSETWETPPGRRAATGRSRTWSWAHTSWSRDNLTRGSDAGQPPDARDLQRLVGADREGGRRSEPRRPAGGRPRVCRSVCRRCRSGLFRVTRARSCRQSSGARSSRCLAV